MHEHRNCTKCRQKGTCGAPTANAYYNRTLFRNIQKKNILYIGIEQL